MSITDLSPLETLELRRDDLFAQLCREGGTPREWAEVNRMTAALQNALSVTPLPRLPKRPDLTFTRCKHPDCHHAGAVEDWAGDHWCWEHTEHAHMGYGPLPTDEPVEYDPAAAEESAELMARREPFGDEEE